MPLTWYASGSTMNVAVSLRELETAVILLSDPAAPLKSDYDKWNACAGLIADVMVSGGKFHILIEEDDREADEPGGWRVFLPGAPQPYKSRVEAALGFFAERYGHSFDADKVELIA